MSLYMKEHVFSWGDKFSIYDDAGNVKYTVKGEVFSFGTKLHLFDVAGNEIAFIEQKIFTFLPRYSISQPNKGTVEVVKEFSFFIPKYSVNPLGWTIQGDFFSHEYEVASYGQTIAAVSKTWFSFGDAYAIRFGAGVDEVLALAVVLVIDACIDAQEND
jgi:uncharacterized protein YxjI